MMTHSNLEGRIRKHGYTATSAFAENINFNDKTAVDCISSWLIDDGVKSRGHRKNIMSDKYNYVGIGSANVKGSVFTVAIFASGD